MCLRSTLSVFIASVVQGRTRSVIIRFVNRKNAYLVLDNSNSLRYTKFRRYFVTENLCPTYRNTFNVLYKGKKNGIIDDVWSYNGIVSAKMVKEDEPSVLNNVKNAELFLLTSQIRKSSREVVDSVDSAPMNDSESSQNMNNTQQVPDVNNKSNSNSNIINNNNSNNNVSVGAPKAVKPVDTSDNKCTDSSLVTNDVLNGITDSQSDVASNDVTVDKVESENENDQTNDGSHSLLYQVLKHAVGKQQVDMEETKSDVNENVVKIDKLLNENPGANAV